MTRRITERLLGLGGGVYGRADALLERAQAGSRALVASLLRDSTTADEKAAVQLVRRGGGGLAAWEKAWLERRLPPPPARLLCCGADAARVALALAGEGYAVDLLDPSGPPPVVAAAPAGERVDLSELDERRVGERRGALRRLSERRIAGERRRARARVARGFGEWHEAADAEARAGYRERGADLRAAERRSEEERREAQRRQTALARSDATPLSLAGRLEELAAAVLDGARTSPIAPLAERRYGAVLLLDGALGRVFDRAARLRALSALDRLCGQGPLLATVERSAAERSRRASSGERLGHLVGRALGRLRRIDAGGRDLVFTGAAGYRHAFDDGELAELAAATDRALEWDAEPGACRATFVALGGRPDGRQRGRA